MLKNSQDNAKNIQFTDSHCHLTYERDDGLKPEFLVKEALREQVTTMLTICTEHREYPTLQTFAEAHKEVFCTYGIHPNHVGDENFPDSVLEQGFENALTHPKTVGFGESGLDDHYNVGAKALQQKRFEQHLEAARTFNMPLVIHTRDAEEDTMKMVDASLAKGESTLIFHCFTGTQKLADFANERGIYVSASGITTFKSAQDLRDVFKTIPAERLLIETDSPYLAPMPHRSKPNRPAWVVRVAECLAKERDTSLKTVAEVTTQNFLNAFPRVTQWRELSNV